MFLGVEPKDTPKVMLNMIDATTRNIKTGRHCYFQNFGTQSGQMGNLN